MKQDWKDAPGWAQYLAMDGDQRWHWFECKPFFIEHLGEWEVDAGHACVAFPASATLEKRPEAP